MQGDREPEVDTRGRQLTERSWEDNAGLIGRFEPGHGARAIAVEEFPTGPDVGTPLPEIVALAHTGETIDVHQLRNGGPAVVVFYRSAVW